MAIIVKPGAGAGRGAERFLVNPPTRFSAEQHLLLRPRYNEYPERYSLNPLFPQPGRRGASRPPPSSGDSETPQTTYPPTYPTPRARPPVETRSENPLSPGEPGAGAIASCIPRGDSFAFIQSVNAATTQIVPLHTIMGPFVVTHYMVSHDGGTGSNVGVKMLIGVGPRPAEPFDSSGIPIFRNADGIAEELDPELHAFDGFPNLHIGQGPHHIKAIFRNGSGAQREFNYIVDVIYL